jgi:hypothetical protein
LEHSHPETVSRGDGGEAKLSGLQNNVLLVPDEALNAFFLERVEGEWQTTFGWVLDVAIVLDEVDWIFAALEYLINMLFAGHHRIISVTMNSSRNATAQIT